MKSDDLLSTLSLPPVKQSIDLPVITKDPVLPFEKLEWENFERFCFQFGCKKMECLDTSHPYGRRGQKQDGIDLYFCVESRKVVWQIKRYKKFSHSDIADAVEIFLNGKWKDKVDDFGLFVACSLDDVAAVDEIDRQTDILKEKGINFYVYDANKLSIAVKDFPDLIGSFFGQPWLEALGLSLEDSSVTPLTKTISTMPLRYLWNFQKDMIYIVITDDSSLAIWTQMNKREKKKFTYNKFQPMQFLILGAKVYKGSVCYQRNQDQWEILSTIEKQHSEPFEKARIHLFDNPLICDVDPDAKDFSGHIGL